MNTPPQKHGTDGSSLRYMSPLPYPRKHNTGEIHTVGTSEVKDTFYEFVMPRGSHHLGCRLPLSRPNLSSIHHYVRSRHIIVVRCKRRIHSGSVALGTPPCLENRCSASLAMQPNLPRLLTDLGKHPERWLNLQSWTIGPDFAAPEL